MLRNKKSGFTLIELMVVIVIIGVLASLAIPRFSQVSARSKAAEGPRLLSMFESAQLTALADEGKLLTSDKLATGIGGFDAKSTWWDPIASGGGDANAVFTLKATGIGGGVTDNLTLIVTIDPDGKVEYSGTGCTNDKLKALIKAHCAKQQKP